MTRPRGGETIDEENVSREESFLPKQDLLPDEGHRSRGALLEPLPGFDYPYEIDFQALSDRLADVPDEANDLLRLLDGQRTLREALSVARDQAQAAVVAREVSALGIIRPVEAGSSDGGAASAAAASESAGSAGGGSLAARNDATPPATAGASGRVAPPGPPRIVRFPARPKRSPRPDSSVDPAEADLLDESYGREPDALLPRAGPVRGRSVEYARGGRRIDFARPRYGQGSTRDRRWRGWAGAIFVAAALAAAVTVFYALALMHRQPEAVPAADESAAKVPRADGRRSAVP